MSSIKHKTIYSLKWSALEKIGQFSIQFIISVILARLLGPEEYAIVGVLNIFVVISSVFVDAGFSQGLIRKLDCNADDYNSVFWFNLFSSILLYIVLFFLMPVIADIFKDSNLIETGRVLMLIIPLQALNVVQTTIVNKKLQFKRIAKYTLVVTPIAGVIGVLIAYNGLGVWALIIQTLVYTLLISLVFWIKSDWRPKLRFKIQPIIELFSFSFKLFISSLLNSLFNNIYSIIIAKLYPKIQFGYFSQAQKYATLPTNLFESILNRMTYPILATLQNDVGFYRNTYIKMQMTMFAFFVPFMLTLTLCGREGVILILGDNWEPSILFFQILCIGGITLPFHPLAMSTLKVFGKSSLILNLEIIKKMLIIISIIVSLSWGVIGLVCGQVIYLWIVLVINLYYCGKQIGYSLKEQVKDIYPYVIVAFIAIVISLISTYFIINMLILLLVKIVFFVGTYFLCVYTIKIRQFTIINDIIRQNLKWL